jgi:hypothetical protein|tara:strand:+ start:16996 stop:17097 length:102 start_codon:yes stop_codon:yes gene_type:complete
MELRSAKAILLDINAFKKTIEFTLVNKLVSGAG